MKYLIGVALIAIGASWHAVARAEVSEDLKFCAALKSSKERLGCYDAAMRIGKNARSAVAVPEPVVAKVSTAVLVPVPTPARFSGLYVGVTGGYEFANSKTSVPTDPFPGLINRFFVNPDVPIDSMRGAKVGAVIGYNAVAEPLLFGFEGRAQYSLSSASQSGQGSTALPQNFPFTCPVYPICQEQNIQPFTLSAPVYQNVSRYHQWQIDLSARSGMTFGDWLFYAKAGAGAEDTFYKSSTTFTISSCDPTVVRQRSDAAIVVTGCNSVSSQTVGGVDAQRTVSPIVLLGGGFERNFGDFFLRAEGEFTTHFMKGGGVYYSPSANVAGGYRF
jgi:hypothetical protein